MMIYDLIGNWDSVEMEEPSTRAEIAQQELFDETTTAEELPIPWEDMSSVVEDEAGVVEAAAIETQLEPQSMDEPAVESADEPVFTDPAPIDAVRARKLQICDMIERVEESIAAVEIEIADLAQQLKDAKKSREAKVERLRELACELKNAKRHVEEKQRNAAGGGEGEEGESGKSDDAIEDALSDRECEGSDDTSADDDGSTNSAPYYNPWDHWEQGVAITSVRLLVPVDCYPAGNALSVFDVEPPQVEGDSLSGKVFAFRPSTNKTIEVDKRDCSPMLPGVEEAVVGRRIGSRESVASSPPGRDVREIPMIPRATRGPVNQDDDSWRNVPVSRLGLPSSLVAILVDDNSIRTIGDIQEWTRFKRLTDLKKVGQAKAEKIEEALVEFWKKR